MVIFKNNKFVNNFNVIELMSITILMILFIFVNDKKIIIGLPFLAIILYGMLKNKDKREIINKNLGIVGAILFIFGLSLVNIQEIGVIF